MIKTKNIKVIDVHDWDKLVQEVYGKPYIFQQQDGCQSRGLVSITIPDYSYDWEDAVNESIPEVINGDEMCVKFNVWLERDVKTPLNPTDEELENCGYFFKHDDRKSWCESDSRIMLFWERNFYPTLQVVANDLYEKGHIEAGDYSIDINW